MQVAREEAVPIIAVIGAYIEFLPMERFFADKNKGVNSKQDYFVFEVHTRV